MRKNYTKTFKVISVDKEMIGEPILLKKKKRPITPFIQTVKWGWIEDNFMKTMNT